MPRKRTRMLVAEFSRRFMSDVLRLELSRNPLWDSREILGFVARALPRKSAKELRERLEELDALY
ncbi:hypothetical protein SAMN04488564_1286 [Lentzea waywayandensis]|uniref:Uncharacterized protein n=1 Tax=Lentzea waywayandensis TaxID=84724 RepID=A0A1I6FJH6_9PSEU|nr:hypothetical protein [Lentzea waywayandensis]SFR30091.1 hypothetical protein SAMN04488564_1286 [Lentzea waywayandensis]